MSTVFDRICHQRTWIVVGYSGQDPIFSQITRLGHFTDDLFWIGYNDQEPQDNVRDQLLDKPNSNAYWIKGYNSDTFFLELHSKLKIDTPEIFNKPFSFLKALLNNVTDIEVGGTKKEHQALLDNVKTRLGVAKKQAEAAIKVYEEGDSTSAPSKIDINRDKLKQQIIESGIKNDYTLVNYFIENIQDDDIELKELVSDLIISWSLRNFELEQNSDDKINLSIKKLEQAVALNPNNYTAYYNWGIKLMELGVLHNEISYYEQAIKRYKKSIELNPNQPDSYDGWCYVLLQMAEMQSGSKRKRTLLSALEKANKTVELGGEKYNLACCYALLKDKEKAFSLLSESLKRKEITTHEVLNDKDWKDYLDDKDFVNIISRFQQS